MKKIKNLSLIALTAALIASVVCLTACKFNFNKNYAIRYELDGGENHADNPTTYDGTSDVVIKPATKESFVFAGWTDGLTNVPQRNFVIKQGRTGDITLTAHYKTSPYLLTAAGSGYEPIYYDEGDIVEEFLPVEKPHYDFVGYFYDRDGLDRVAFPFLMPGKDVTIYAVFKPTVYTVNYNVDGVLKSATYTVDDADFRIPAPEKEGYSFLYWQAVDGTRYYDLNLENGVPGNVEVTAVFEINAYTITFNEMGGSQVSDARYEYNGKIQLPKTTKPGYSFDGWYELNATEPFGFTEMPARNVELIAKWTAVDGYACTFECPDGAFVEADFFSGTKVAVGDSVHLTASPYSSGGVFDYWQLNGKKYSFDTEIGYKVSDEDLSFIAVYSQQKVVAYTLGSGTDLSLSIYNAVSVEGERITSADYSSTNNTLTVKRSFLDKLDCSRHVFTVSTGTGNIFLYIDISANYDVVSGLKLDYDIAFPKVTLLFDDNGSDRYQVSVNGSAYVDCNSGSILEKFDKSASNTVIVRNLTKSASQTITTEGYDKAVYGDYFEKSFNYAGKSWDFVAFTENEFEIILEYYALVEMPLNYSGTTTKTYDGYFGVFGDFYDAFVANAQYYYENAFSCFSSSYVPNYGMLSFNASGYENKYGLRLMTTNEFNTKINPCTVTEKQDSFGLLQTSDRTADYDGFAIDDFASTQLIRTIYELDELPYGVKPIFNGDSMAKQSYEKAKEILKKYVSDDMTDAEKVRTIYDYLALNVQYDDDILKSSYQNQVGSYRCFTSYGALVDGLAVCDGIASAFKIMCCIEGIECVEVVGQSNGSGHAWNKVNLGGVWYGLDATWAYQDGYVTHEFLFINEFDLVATEHVEKGFLSSGGYTERVADCRYDYYTRVVFENGYDYYISSQKELNFILQNAVDNSLKGVEVKTDYQSFIFKQMLNIAVNSLSGNVAVNMVMNANGVVYLTIN
ncbi:MAG: InlB B-repeat-containing protein [Christensenellaceae bacterium]